jgi:hypothetical protein
MQAERKGGGSMFATKLVGAGGHMWWTLLLHWGIIASSWDFDDKQSEGTLKTEAMVKTGRVAAKNKSSLPAANDVHPFISWHGESCICATSDAIALAHTYVHAP